MLRTSILLVAVVFTVVVLPGCPDRAEVIDTVGGAPGRQVEQARERANAAEAKLKKNTDAAAAAVE